MDNGDTIEEYRVGGTLRMVKVAPAAPDVPAVRPPGFPDAVWNRALRDNGGDPRRAAAALAEYNRMAP